ncbi:TetR/AcrR family transcriptional regulator C-terminal domain-containing protein [Streptomyces sp. NPDC059104]|uniref:TetR/AcrR family transcriptional regulator C-terminal domain-containing protein n=1 Tax=Streptomyces sp. NPDC059104 TaxID=3346729 RepID=UPI0036C55256
MAGATLLIPDGIRHIDRALAALDGMGQIHAAVSLFGYVRGHAVGLAPESDAARTSGVSGQEWTRAQEARLAALVDGGAFPAFAPARAGSALSPEYLFHHGLTTVLDGLATSTGSGSAPAETPCPSTGRRSPTHHPTQEPVMRMPPGGCVGAVAVLPGQRLAAVPAVGDPRGRAARRPRQGAPQRYDDVRGGSRAAPGRGEGRSPKAGLGRVRRAAQCVAPASPAGPPRTHGAHAPVQWMRGGAAGAGCRGSEECGRPVVRCGGRSGEAGDRPDRRRMESRFARRRVST